MQADIVLFPFIDRFALCAPRHAGYDVQAACGGAIGQWLDVMSARQSCIVSCANSDALLQAYRCTHHLSLLY